MTEDLPVQPEQALHDPTLLPEVIEADAKTLLDQGLSQRDRLAGLAHELASGSALDLARWHACAWRACFQEEMMEPVCTHSDAQLEQAGCGADLVLVGHTHVPLNRRVGRYHAINLGSVSNPVTPPAGDLCAS